MNLTKPSLAHLSELLSWVSTQEQLVAWASPNMRYPANVDTLEKDLHLTTWPSFSLVSEAQELLAFGQYYSRLGHCHLCRLIVSPDHRGLGVVQKLVELISNEGTRELGVSSCSLFVYRDNLSAIKAYQKIGYVCKDYPGDKAMDDCLYMVKN